MKSRVIGLVWLVGGICFGAKLPPGYKRCNRKSPDVDQCLVQALQGVVGGIDRPLPEIGLPSLDPLLISHIEIPAKSGNVAVHQKYTNAKIMGLQTSEVQKLQFDFDKKILEWKVIVSPLVQIAEYEVHGKILLLPVEGTGASNVSSDKCTMHMISPFEITEKKGKKYLKFENSHLNLVPTHIYFNFENLFNGNRELGDNINRVLNENWHEIFVELQDGLEATYGAILESVANSVFSRVPLSEIFLDGF